MKKITFICTSDDEAEMFIADSEITPDIIAYLDAGGGDHELQIQGLKMEDVDGPDDV